MFIAKVKDTGELVDAMEVLMEGMKHLEFVCPHCNSPLQLKNGSCNAPHFAHLSGTACNDYYYNNDMSEWHRYCQSLFPKECREVKITGTRKYDSEDPEEWEEHTHIADVCIGNYVIEFQHSPIDIDTFDERSCFYTEQGYKLIWIFDFSDKNLEEYDINKWKMKNAMKSAMYWDPRNYKQDRMIMCFEFNGLLYHICWARPSEYDPDLFSWSRFCTKHAMNRNINTLEELAEHIIEKCNKKAI